MKYFSKCQSIRKDVGFAPINHDIALENTSRVAYQVHFPTSICEHCRVGDRAYGEVLKRAFFLNIHGNINIYVSIFQLDIPG